MGKRLNLITCIYAIINSWNGMIYIGSAVDFDNRKASHIASKQKLKETIARKKSEQQYYV